MAKETGLIVRLEDGRTGIAYNEDQKKEFKGKNHPHKGKQKVLVTLVSETFTKLDKPKVLVRASKLNVIGFSD